MYIGIFWLGRKKLSALQENFNEKRKKVSENIIEKINLIFEVKKSSKEQYEINQVLTKKLKNQKNSFQKTINFDVFINVIFSFIYLIITLGTLFLTIYYYRQGEITIGEVLSVNLFAMFLVWNYEWLIKTISQITKKITIIGDAEKLLLFEVENNLFGKIKKELLGKIEFKNIFFKYENEQKKNVFSFNEKKHFALKNISLKIEPGQKIALVGKSGSGKSTLVDFIGGFYLPDRGKILIDDLLLQNWDINTLRRKIAYVSQDIAIFNSTIAENIAYGLEYKPKMTEIKNAAHLAQIADFIENLPEGYQTAVGEKGLKLSGGQRQRIAIARAILRNPKILILDEPTSALDIESEKKITGSLKKLMKNRTTIIIAHRLSTVKETDKIYVFTDGDLVEEGKYEELLKISDGHFKEMHDLHLGLE